MNEPVAADWQNDLSKKLEAVTNRLEEYDGTEDNLRGVLPEQFGVSGGENFSAENHRGREILELLQNANDVTFSRNHEIEHPRTVYISYVFTPNSIPAGSRRGGPTGFAD